MQVNRSCGSVASRTGSTAAGGDEAVVIVAMSDDVVDRSRASRAAAAKDRFSEEVDLLLPSLPVRLTPSSSAAWPGSQLVTVTSSRRTMATKGCVTPQGPATNLSLRSRDFSDDRAMKTARRLSALDRLSPWV